MLDPSAVFACAVQVMLSTSHNLLLCLTALKGQGDEDNKYDPGRCDTPTAVLCQRDAAQSVWARRQGRAEGDSPLHKRARAVDGGVGHEEGVHDLQLRGVPSDALRRHPDRSTLHTNTPPSSLKMPLAGPDNQIRAAFFTYCMSSAIVRSELDPLTSVRQHHE